MAHEIERKYLVDKSLWEKVIKDKAEYVHQLYLHADTQKAIRVRIIGKKAFITIKSKLSDIKRLEFEYEIPLEDAKLMMEAYADCPQVEKTRYFIKEEHHTWEIDVFHGKNEGLIVAEIELSHEDELFALPHWVAEEVTHDPTYLNVNLAK
ncbi:CYTH domain-containing protein [Parvicella tangerina]|uniref:Inorganic triphosphatase n=1 Tax=Parvicella tangerina TaxID=2829795 RepID=A0A916NH79_9FLAO|nr:CYTH domain-containing protein [Parvicella tangerina]CAG5082349.1 Inorganic triphosphatase [Parvicella tangerina]